MNARSHFSIDPSGHAEVTGELTLDTVAAIFQQGEDAARRGLRPREVDLGGVTRVDSSGLALILEWQARANRDEQHLKLSNAPADLLSLASLCEAAGLLQLDGRAA